MDCFTAVENGSKPLSLMYQEQEKFSKEEDLERQLLVWFLNLLHDLGYSFNFHKHVDGKDKTAYGSKQHPVGLPSWPHTDI